MRKVEVLKAKVEEWKALLMLILIQQSTSSYVPEEDSPAAAVAVDSDSLKCRAASEKRF
jgi:hypothetical protein